MTPKKKSPISLPKEPFTPHTKSLKLSAAWRSMTIHERLLLDRLEIEHECHAGRENGALTVSWDQFREHGVGHNAIRASIARLVRIGILEITHRGTAGRGPAHCSRYRLTYLPAKTVDQHGNVSYPEPTNEWRTAPAVAKLQRPDWQRGSYGQKRPNPRPRGNGADQQPEDDPARRNF